MQDESGDVRQPGVSGHVSLYPYVDFYLTRIFGSYTDIYIGYYGEAHHRLTRGSAPHDGHVLYSGLQ